MLVAAFESIEGANPVRFADKLIGKIISALQTLKDPIHHGPDLSCFCIEFIDIKVSAHIYTLIVHSEIDSGRAFLPSLDTMKYSAQPDGSVIEMIHSIDTQVLCKGTEMFVVVQEAAVMYI